MVSMQILSEHERSKLLEALQSAPDEVLIDAVRQCKDYRVTIQSTFKEIQGFIGMKAVDVGAPPFRKNETETVEAKAPSQPAAQIDKNETPPGIAASRIGGETKDKILARCMRPSTADDVNKFLGRGAGKLDETKGLLKLLWDRGELVYSNGAYRTKK